jgi:cysteine-rich repeat protein
VHSVTSVLAAVSGVVLVAFLSCSETEEENACPEPGGSEACTCADGRKSVRTCNAYAIWGECYCYRPGCGNGSVDDAEECDDGNTNDGDGCSAMCLTEIGPGGGGGFGGNPVTTSTGPATSTSSGMGGMGGGGTGGTGGTAGMGGAGGTGGA